MVYGYGVLEQTMHFSYGTWLFGLGWICGATSIAVLLGVRRCSIYGLEFCKWFCSFLYPSPLNNSHNSLVSLYRKLPLRSLSRAWGKFNDLNLPEWSRKPLLSIYIRLFGCDLKEAAVEDLKHYKNLGEFFRRGLKPNVRPVSPDHSLVMPSDGKVLIHGVADGGTIEQVKNVTYSLKGFLGPNNSQVYEDIHSSSLSDLEIDKKLREADSEYESMSESNFYRSMLHDRNNRLHYIVVYLAPGDYHRFHSPTDWVVSHRRHFPGELLSVNPMIARWVQGLFNMNERAVYSGTWKHGFFSMTAVGATNVGSIKTYFDQKLETNLRSQSSKQMVYYDHAFTDGVPMKKGELFGEFNLGSTIVLIFEAPKSFEFTDIACNETVRMGQPLGDKTIAKSARSASAQG
ncbi:phosphatidylserine decarboxylase proenzyme, mitochondrial-like isoform X2 [Watersipora subatra]|uniref:phosphatidylserine decarboxylase proenzyme, mitochondrial-like isoform X2 n=1 Tax=Watersipora subatra TaxID=2589382 RepID=UPI00355C5A6B